MLTIDYYTVQVSCQLHSVGLNALLWAAKYSRTVRLATRHIYALGGRMSSNYYVVTKRVESIDEKPGLSLK